MGQPLILTLTLDDEHQAFFNRLRTRYFPPERNFLQAHLTLFHHLLPEQDVASVLEPLCAQSPFRMSVTGVQSIGKGVVYRIESDTLQALHRRLQTVWWELLIPQDRQKLWPHITVQNKVTPDVARSTRALLAEDFRPFDLMATGFSLWTYLDGPWRRERDFPFRGQTSSAR